MIALKRLIDWRASLALLVALHRGFDGLSLGGVEGRQGIGVNEDPYGSRSSWCALDEAQLLKHKDHLMNGGRRHAEVTVQVGFGRWSAQNDRVSMDEGEILPLLV
jgi:hypothetical protein